MRARPIHAIPQCTARDAGDRCERPAKHGGPHRVEQHDEHGQPTGRIRSWFDRWSAA